jgi:glyoxylase-like metal-dependent hydrolase (beta-lactamase superfamily II)
MPNYICVTCGVQYAETAAPPAECPICLDDRQYVGHNGQQWTTLADLQTSHHNLIKSIEPGLVGIATEPRFAIGQRALLIKTADGNVLWDCISLIDDATVAALQDHGGVDAIAISHPHFYDSMIEWSRVLGNAPIYLHESNRAWVMRPDDAVHFWEGETFPLKTDLTLIRCGGHFPGSTVLHWPGGADRQGVLMTGDTIQVVADRRWVTFMYSYPNSIPLNAAAVRGIAEAVEPYSYARLYGGWWETVVDGGADEAVRRSATRYLRAIQE